MARIAIFSKKHLDVSGAGIISTESTEFFCSSVKNTVFDCIGGSQEFNEESVLDQYNKTFYPLYLKEINDIHEMIDVNLYSLRLL
jgi:hypothetical protein